MKTAAKVFIIIGMVVGFLWIVPPIVGFIALDRLKTARSKNELTGIGICTLLFCNTIGGILMLCLSDSDLSGNQTYVNNNIAIDANQNEQPKETKVEPSAENKSDEIAANIEKLKKLKEQGVITEEEYEALRKKEISKLLGE